jgi:hypothetical protein
MSTAKSTGYGVTHPGTSGFIDDARNNQQGRIRLATNQEAALGAIEDVAVDPKQARGIVPSITITDGEDGTAAIAIQGVDAGGVVVAKQVVVDVWFAATSGAAPADLGDVSADTGTILGEPTTDAYIRVLSNAAGLIELTFTRTTDGAVFAHAIVNPTLVIGVGAVTGN